jgi:hypothetical protein
MYYTIYRITNLVNNKTYIGKHKTNNLDDGYMGSGIALNRAKLKHGIENFKKHIIHILSNDQEMNEMEKKLVVVNETTYNLKEGGDGGFDFINDNNLRPDNSKNLLCGKEFIDRLKKNGTYDLWVANGQARMRPGYDIYIKETGGGVWLGKKHKPESINKQKETFKRIGHSQGEKNSQHGTIWITDGISNKKIKKEESIPDGWRRGRTL